MNIWLYTNCHSGSLITVDVFLLIFQEKWSSPGRKGIFPPRSEMLSTAEEARCRNYRESWAPDRSSTWQLLLRVFALEEQSLVKRDEKFGEEAMENWITGKPFLKTRQITVWFSIQTELEEILTFRIFIVELEKDLQDTLRQLQRWSDQESSLWSLVLLWF